MNFVGADRCFSDVDDLWENPSTLTHSFETPQYLMAVHYCCWWNLLVRGYWRVKKKVIGLRRTDSTEPRFQLTSLLVPVVRDLMFVKNFFAAALKPYTTASGHRSGFTRRHLFGCIKLQEIASFNGLRKVSWIENNKISPVKSITSSSFIPPNHSLFWFAFQNRL